MEHQTIICYTKSDFRKWLRRHHKSEGKVCVIVHKRHTGKPAPTHNELMREAICFGWIDTTIKKINEDTFARYFVKRNQNSRWSDNTIRYGKELIEQGRMMPQGLHFFNLGLAKPTHDHGVPKNPDIPKDLKLAIAKNKNASRNFKGWRPSTKRMLYRWILSAKQVKTRESRVSRVLSMAEKGVRPTW